MELRDVKKNYTDFYNTCKKAGRLVPNLDVEPITDYQIFYIDFDFYISLVQRTDRENVKNYDHILKETHEYFPASNMSICIKGDWGELLVVHYVSLPKNEYKYTYLVENEKSGIIRSQEEKTRFMSHLLLAVIFSLNDKKTLIGGDSVSMRRKSGQSEIVPITYVSNKKYSSKQLSLSGEPIEWKHSWEVIGHWRAISGIGKNRNGDYLEINRTWINPCIKGKGELIKKIRIIK